jgi:hypothetical protein
MFARRCYGSSCIQSCSTAGFVGTPLVALRQRMRKLPQGNGRSAACCGTIHTHTAAGLLAKRRGVGWGGVGWGGVGLDGVGWARVGWGWVGWVGALGGVGEEETQSVMTSNSCGPNFDPSPDFESTQHADSDSGLRCPVHGTL